MGKEHRGEGVTVGIVAPSGFPADPGAVHRATQRLEAFGCSVRNFFDPAVTCQRFAGSESARAGQLHQACMDPDVTVVLALRGGYGLSRLLSKLDLELLAQSGKLFVGHSDFTALQMAMLARAGTISFAGPMACDDFSSEEPSPFTLQQFWACLHGPDHTLVLHGKPDLCADIEGVLWGGNLTILAHLAGTPYLPQIEGGILFVEDVNEHPYRIERMLLQLLHAGVLNQKAIVLGDFSRYRLSEQDNGYNFETMLDYLRAAVGIPIFRGLPFGHVRDKATLAVGAKARLRADGESCTLTMSRYPCLVRS